MADSGGRLTDGREAFPSAVCAGLAASAWHSTSEKFLRCNKWS